MSENAVVPYISSQWLRMYSFGREHEYELGLLDIRFLSLPLLPSRASFRFASRRGGRE